MRTECGLYRDKVLSFQVKRHNSKIKSLYLLSSVAKNNFLASPSYANTLKLLTFTHHLLCLPPLPLRPMKITQFFHKALLLFMLWKEKKKAQKKKRKDFVMISNIFFLFRYLFHVHTRAQTLNYVHQYVPKGTTYFDKTIRIDKNPIKTALNVCKHLISKRVYAVVVSHDEKDSSGHDLSPAAVSYTSGFYQIPVIGISSRDAAFSDKNIHVSFLRTVPPYYHQADVWLEMLSHFGYTKACIKLGFSFFSLISLL